MLLRKRNEQILLNWGRAGETEKMEKGGQKNNFWLQGGEPCDIIREEPVAGKRNTCRIRKVVPAELYNLSRSVPANRKNRSEKNVLWAMWV